MAERLAIPKQNLHNLLQLAELPDEVVSAFAEPGDLKVRHGMRLSPLIKDERYRDAILGEAAIIAAEQKELLAAGAEKIEGSKVCERLAAAVTPSRPAPSPKAKPAPTAASGKAIENGRESCRESGGQDGRMST